MTTQKTGTKSAAREKAPARARNPKPPAKARRATGVPKPPAAKAAASEAPVTAAPAVAAPDLEMRKQELLAAVVERADIKKKYAKPVVEAMIEVLGEALAEGRELNLQPLGKLKYNRTKETENARIIIAKIRQKKPRKSEAAAGLNQSIADAAE